jgi:hypothetical protein
MKKENKKREIISPLRNDIGSRTKGDETGHFSD